MALFGKQLTVSARASAGGAAISRVSGVAPQPRPKGEINLDNILKLIPGEVVPIFITGVGIGVPAVPQWRAIVFWVCFIVCGWLRAVASKPAGPTRLLEAVNWRLVFVSLAAFFIWAHAVSIPAPVLGWFPAPAWGFFAMIFGVLAPTLVTAT